VALNIGATNAAKVEASNAPVLDIISCLIAPQHATAGRPKLPEAVAGRALCDGRLGCD
jgi:hypothetical protein